MFTDSHAHLNRLDLSCHQDSLPNALAAAKAAGVHRIMSIMCDFDEYEAIRKLVDTPVDGLQLGMSVGIHPCQSPESLTAATVERLIELACLPEVWAIGETGLDYHWSSEHKTLQQASLAAHIHASQQLKKPVIIHTREARQDTLDILAAERAEHGIIHCFTEDYDTAKRALDLGFYISLSGIVSFKNATELQEVAKKLPKDRILIETDSPYLAPVPKRGKPNEPAFVPYVAEFLAGLYAMSAEEVGIMTDANFDRLINQYS